MAYTQDELSQMSRKELQALNKARGLKANSKTEDLIKQLLESSSSSTLATSTKKQPIKNNAKSTDKDEMGMATPRKVVAAQPAPPMTQAKTIVYQTSPNTKAALSSLQKTVETLQKELASTKALVDELAQARGPQVDIEGIVEARLESFKLTMIAEVERHGLSSTNQITALEERLINVEAAVAEKASQAEHGDSLEKSTGTAESSEAPPTSTFATFLSPISVPRGQNATSTPARVIGQGLPGQTTAAKGKTPRAASRSTSAIPPHVLQSESSKRSPRRNSVPGPSSPAPSTVASLGKRGRDSDASTQSIDVEAVLSPTSERGGGSTSLLGNLTMSAGHIRKRIRVDDEENERTTSDDSAAFHTVEERSFVGLRAPRDTIVPLKDDAVGTTGASRALSRSPSRDPSFFASLMAPGTPTRTTLATSPSFFGASNNSNGENAAPTAARHGSARKSLPMASLPFPIVSPFKSARKSSAATSSSSSSMLARRASSLFADASNTNVGGPRSSTNSRPGTPAASKTLYGTESNTRFAEAVSPYSGPRW